MPEETRQELSDLEWRGMAGMRDQFIHGYFPLDVPRVEVSPEGAPRPTSGRCVSTGA